MERFGISKKVMWAGIVLILVTGMIHLIDAPSSFGDATYKGILFVANGIGAAVAALGIYRGARDWGWSLGLLIAGGALAGYIISRTLGLPGLGPDVWLEPLGIASLIVEAAYVWLAVRALADTERGQRALMRSTEEA
jgi:hypothetical protein